LPDDHAWLEADAADSRTALHEAAQIISSGQAGAHQWVPLASGAYAWLRGRQSLRAVTIQLIPGEPRKEGSTPVATTFDLSDVDQVDFTLTGLDAKGASVPAPADTWTWALADPDTSGATLTVSADTLTATVGAGVPDTNLMLTVTGSTSGLTGAEAIIVQASAAATVGLVAGTPVPEA
jgi:hypothetical protein